MGILIIESDLRDHLKDICKQLKRKTIDFVTVAGIEFLIELKNDATKLVPREWIKVSGTKFVSRFHTPTIIKLVAERDQRKELLAMECDAAYLDFLTRIATHYETLRWIVSCVAELDCLLSLALLSNSATYVKPTILSATEASCTKLDLVDFRHPIIETILTDGYIPNSCHLSTDGLRTLIVSGPNMGGKSSFIKAIALVTIMAQIGCYVPCSQATLSVLDGVYVRMGASDNILTRESTFMVELHETSDIMATATEQSLVILDELGRGTSTFDGLAIASSVLDHFLHNIKCLMVFVTHYPSIGQFGAQDHCEATHMSYLAQDGGVTFLYKLAAGMATRSYGLNVARLAGLQESIIGRADEQAKIFEDQMQARDRAATTVSWRL
ncbi:DNA mismatch repair protein msh3 [Taphrina deformans PYCC 5710]|uniref:MutS protein homolog 3 n=1 Tax=Taphrina deformans (strain PYCC 5710 / ATCC 11124 / CBS 356.35 / IMI 108563 / JCM 9778 / NBRC 8474) TaxID=1097556 RepID=R5A1S2_TAPDE|nr:DNA mismatch repair protein msh3 [Taphrina deformans PYCC 5710]|eukprot:CCX35452.1 DNA mismatch repair protein msh3 [Taphrina deformans PYCC 5710]